MMDVTVYIFIAVVLLLVIKFLSSKQQDNGENALGNQTEIPGLKPHDEKSGNFQELSEYKSLHEFLVWLHGKFGPIAKFYLGKEMVVSTASQGLFKQQMKIFDRPPSLFLMFEPLINPESIQYANKEDGKWRRNHYDIAYSHGAMTNYYDEFYQLAEELAVKWLSKPADEQIPLCQDCFIIAIKAIVHTSMGPLDEQLSKEMIHNYHVAWDDMEQRLTGDYPAPDSEREKQFNHAKKVLYDTVKHLVEQRRGKIPGDPNQKILLDILIENEEAGNIPMAQVLSDSLTFMIGGFHTSGNLLIWAIYYLSTHPDVEEKLYLELLSVLGPDGKVTPENIGELVYLRQVLDESLRCAVIAPYAARFNDEADIILDGYVIPKGTPVMQALGVTEQDPKLWPEPEKFDPDRFAPELQKSRPVFEPFGFAGKRKCPGYRFSYVELTVFLSILARKMKFHFVPGQTVTQKYGLVGQPADEVWITVEMRS